MNYFYSASTMGYGDGRFWHKFFNFPNFPRVTKTLTLTKKQGYPFAVVRVGKSVFNKVSLHNIGFYSWLDKYGLDNHNIILSLGGEDESISTMIKHLEDIGANIKGIELNFSCPNVKNNFNKNIPNTTYDIYLKLNYLQDPFLYNLDRVKGIRLNSIPMGFCGGSGLIAQKYNWKYIKHYINEGLNVAGCSAVCTDDFKQLEDMGVKEIGLGSILLINPNAIIKLNI